MVYSYFNFSLIGFSVRKRPCDDLLTCSSPFCCKLLSCDCINKLLWKIPCSGRALYDWRMNKFQHVLFQESIMVLRVLVLMPSQLNCAFAVTLNLWPIRRLVTNRIRPQRDVSVSVSEPANHDPADKIQIGKRIYDLIPVHDSGLKRSVPRASEV